MEHLSAAPPTSQSPAQVRPSRALSSERRRRLDLSSEIKGWGSDLAPEFRPGVPRDQAPDLGIESLYVDVQAQTPTFKIHKSNEHARLTPVFGTACPPRGLSGKIRDIAFKFNEGRLSHWVLLLVADRVDVVEEIAIDLMHARVPNIIQEMGLKSEFKHNRSQLARRALVGSVGAWALWKLVRRSRPRIES